MKTVKVLSVYSVVYFLAFVVKTQGLSLLSSFLFLFLAVFLYCVEKKEVCLRWDYWGARELPSCS